MPPRRYKNYVIEKLESMAEENHSNDSVLRDLLAELDHRSTRRARKLRSQIEKCLSVGPDSPVNSNDSTTVSSISTTQSAKPRKKAHRNTRSTYPLTQEQKAVIEAFSTGASLKVNAFAGAGKTSTLVAIGDSTSVDGLYLSFNRKNADEAKQKFPTNVECSTTHSMACRAVRHKYYKNKMFDSLTSEMIRRELKLEDFSFGSPVGNRACQLDAKQLASLVSSTVRRWLYSAKEDVSRAEVIFTGAIPFWPELARTELEECVKELSGKCWQKMIDPTNPLPLSHDGYVKLWSLDSPRLNADFVLLDEAQDTNPVILDVLKKQKCQIVYVGDRHQQIYEWRGAVNAMDEIMTAHELKLTQSFRFGPAIADVANPILRKLGEEQPLIGNSARQSRIGITRPQAILARTNSNLIVRFIDLIDKGKRVAIQGGSDEQLAILKEMQKIRNGFGSSLSEFLGIRTWEELKSFTETDEGQSFGTLVKLADTHTIPKLIACLRKCSSIESAEVTMSTLHKAKGLEWNKVELLSDFAPKSEAESGKIAKLSNEDLRILYVAVTRAKEELQIPDDVAKFITSLGGYLPQSGTATPHELQRNAQTAEPVHTSSSNVQPKPLSPASISTISKPVAPIPNRTPPNSEISKPQLSAHNPRQPPSNSQGCLVLLGIFFMVLLAFSKASSYLALTIAALK